MFFTMYCCYFLNLLTILLTIITMFQGYIPFSILKANHVGMALLTMIIYMFTQTLIIFFFTGMGVNIRDYVKLKKLSSSFYEENKKIKFILFVPLMNNIFFFILLCISGGAIHRNLIPPFVHGLLFWGWLVHYFSVLGKEISAFQSTVRTVVLMTKDDHKGMVSPKDDHV